MRVDPTTSEPAVATLNKQWSGRGWKVTFDGSAYLVDDRGRRHRFVPSGPGAVEARRRWLRRSLHHDGVRILRLRGATKAEATSIALAHEVVRALAWADELHRVVSEGIAARRWIPYERSHDLQTRRPSGPVIALAREWIRADPDPESELRLVAFSVDVLSHISAANEEILEIERVESRAFFDSIERRPLSDEQIRAVVTFDNRVQVVAAAGSGKTSVMVARAAYAVMRGFVTPDRILLLAFNKAAATELQERVRERFARAGIDATGVRASTFHAFGLEVLGQASGRKPRLAPWVDNGDAARVLQEIVDQLRTSSPAFRRSWELYRLIFGTTPMSSHGLPDDTSKASLKTFAGETVKSYGELVIANWLHVHGVEYEYERPYTYPTATADHSQYRPDFYYPAADLWHEHWALDADGRPPAHFAGYAESIQWKRECHKAHGTELIETSWAEIVFGDGLQRLERELRSRGVVPDVDAARPLPANVGIADNDLLTLIRTFMTHVKSSCLDRAELEARLGGSHRGLAGTRTRVFLDLYWPIHEEWDRRLRANNLVDFEDMLASAAEMLDTGRYRAPYDLVLVDEFQDASRARARIVRGLVSRPGTFALAVGDDWQSINRFAGADIAMMTAFEEHIGPGPILHLTTTFRCPQTICDVSSRFVSRNPQQLRKSVRSAHEGHGAPVEVVIGTDGKTELAQVLDRLSSDVGDGLHPSVGATPSVLVLGRYNFDKALLPARPPANLSVNFRTVHASKGLEADFVIVPRLIRGRYGFPSTITDDPVLELVMAGGDAFPHSEERRLLYVALTRARHRLIVVTTAGQWSVFATELVKDPAVVTVAADGGQAPEPCQRCEDGVLVPRSGKHGAFRGCSRFPACGGTAPALATPPMAVRLHGSAR